MPTFSELKNSKNITNVKTDINFDVRVLENENGQGLQMIETDKDYVLLWCTHGNWYGALYPDFTFHILYTGSKQQTSPENWVINKVESPNSEEDEILIPF